MKLKKPKKFRKVVKFYYPNGEPFEGEFFGGGYFDFYLGHLLVFFFGLIISPVLWIFWFFSNCIGTKKVYYVEIKNRSKTNEPH
jgi:hypothetical protein